MLYIDNQNLYSLQALLNSLMSNVDALAKNAASMGVSYALLVATMPKESARMAVAILIVLPVAFAYPFSKSTLYPDLRSVQSKDNSEISQAILGL